jgi:uncharacterized LabA/DUF88 family protein
LPSTFHTQKCCVLLDGNYVDRLSRHLRFDFIQFQEFMNRRYLVSNYIYYSTVPYSDDEFPKRRLLDWLSYNGFIVREKFESRHQHRNRLDSSSDLSLDIAVCALETCDHLDGILFVTNDTDMLAAISELQRRSKWVALAGELGRSEIGISEDLRRAADLCLPIDAIFNDGLRERSPDPVAG